MIGIQIFDAGARVKINRVLTLAKNPRAVMLGAAREGGNRLKKHFRQKNRSEPNKLGGKRTNYWNQIAQSVSAPVSDSSGRTVTVHITNPTFTQKLFGGVIVAKRARALTIPQIPEAHGRAAAVFEREMGVKLFFLGSEFGSGVLMAQLGNAVKVVYLLRKSVRQDKDPTALPAEPEFTDAVIARAQTITDRQIQAPSGGAL